MKKFFVALNVEIDGVVYAHGSEIELDVEVAKEYSHALRAIEEKTEETGDGRNS